MLNFILPANFSAVSSLFNNSDTVFIIPTFQRPYSWEEKHVNELLKDIDKSALIKNPYHYLSPVHLIRVKPSDIINPAILDLGQFAEWNNTDLKKLYESIQDEFFINHAGSEFRVYYVIDGQQRLTTLYILEHFRSLLTAAGTASLYQSLQGGSSIPRLIQNPICDHDFFKGLCDYINAHRTVFRLPLITNTMAQKRMRKMAEIVEKWITGADPKAKTFINLPNFSISLICLKPDFGLTSFMTLNDRGKQLTVLEKFKALLLEYIISYHVSIGVARFQLLFGSLYTVLDQCTDQGFFSSTSSDEDFMQLISVYIRAELGDRDCLWQSGDKAFEDCFKDQLEDHADKGSLLGLISGWLDKIEQLVKQLGDLSNFVFFNATAITSPSLHFPATSKLVDDYKAVLFSLGLQPGSFALLLKFHELFPTTDWHEQVVIQCHYDSRVKKEIADYLGEMRKSNLPEVNTYLDGLDEKLRCLPDEDKDCNCKISMLEVIERIQIFVWNRGSFPKANFVLNYRATLALSKKDFIQRWVEWWLSSVDCTKYFLRGNGSDNFSYTLKEYERSYKSSVHFDGLELEHIFAQNLTIPFTTIGFRDQADYQNNFLWRIGNMALLSPPLNQALGNNMPYIKAPEYVASSGISVTEKVGNEINSAKANDIVHRRLLEARCAEMALFALERFFPKCIP